ncbi:hypothetical protein WA556_002704 [Blastocystis sp. ATCC 50177/Nand II]
MSYIDRTEEFKLATNVHLHDALQPSSPLPPPSFSVSKFSKVTASLSGKVSKTTLKLQRLTELVRRKSLFDDKATEINQLTNSINQDIKTINAELEELEQFVRMQRYASSQSREYDQGVVEVLKEELMGTTKDFRQVLETRHQNLEEADKRKQRFGNTTPALLGKPIVYQSQASPAAADEHSPLLPRPNGVVSSNAFSIQSSEVIANDYLHERAQAVQDIEAHMTELGSIFERLSTMITEQGEMIDRLDDNLDAAEVNVNAGYQEILKYGQTVFSNRSLMMKLFAVLIFFIIFFLIFLA